MGFWIFLAIYLPLFFLAYLCMAWRQKVLNIKYETNVDFNPTLFAALFVPPIAIVFALAEIVAAKLGIREVGAHAV